MQTLVCQSCGMPMRSPEDFGTNVDGSPSSKYCRYCFQNGEFTAKMEMPEYIEMQVHPSTNPTQPFSMINEREQSGFALSFLISKIIR